MESDDWNASAAPWKLVMTPSGWPISICACLIAVTASPSAAPGARLKEMVADGNCPRCDTCNGAVSSRILAITASGTGVLPTDDGR